MTLAVIAFVVACAAFIIAVGGFILGVGSYLNSRRELRNTLFEVIDKREIALANMSRENREKMSAQFDELAKLVKAARLRSPTTH